MDPREIENVVRLATEEVLRYLSATGGLKTAGTDRDDEVCPGCDQNCAEKCSRKTRAVVDAGADRISCGPAVVQLDAGFAGLIDHTLLKPEASRDEIRKLCQEAARRNAIPGENLRSRRSDKARRTGNRHGDQHRRAQVGPG